MSLGPLPEASCNANASLRLWSGTVNHLLGDIPEHAPRCNYKSRLPAWAFFYMYKIAPLTESA